jgi:low molecular weight protein-tyrosine phosphatase
MMPQPGRTTPALGLKAAAAYGIDLSAHRSSWLTRDLAQSASLLIVFDALTRSAVLDRYPDLKARLVLVGDLAELGDIPDPIDGGPAEFHRVYARIAVAVAELGGLIRATGLVGTGRSLGATSADLTQVAGGE